MQVEIARTAGILLASALAAAALLHLYWAIGGEWALNESLGVRDAAARPPHIRALAVPVIFALSAAALLTLARVGLLAPPLPGWSVRACAWILAAVLASVTVLNATSGTFWERFVIAPVVAMLAALASVVAAGESFD